MRVASLRAEQRERYARHLVLPEVGDEGQRRLRASTVAVVGAGGLGSPVLLYLAAVGVGRLLVADGDRLELSNLNRQVVHATQAIGQPKAQSAAAAIRALNTEVQVETVAQRLDAPAALELLLRADLVCDCTDSFESRQVVHQAALSARRPLVTAAVYGWEGQLTTLRGYLDSAPCYSCVFGQLPPEDVVPAPAVSGVLGAAVGVVGCLQATEAIKQLLEVGDRLDGRLALVDTLAYELRVVGVSKDPDCRLCGTAGESGRRAILPP